MIEHTMTPQEVQAWLEGLGKKVPPKRRHIQKAMTIKHERKVLAPVAKSCGHHWLIDTPTGPTSMGKCKLCGERKEFRNYDQYDDLPKRWARGYGGRE
jgi:hypothetical protein